MTLCPTDSLSPLAPAEAAPAHHDVWDIPWYAWSRLQAVQAFRVFVKANAAASSPQGTPFEASLSSEERCSMAHLPTLGVTACKANPLGLQTRAFMDQGSMRICQSAGQHSVQTSQHSGANGLQTRSRANHHCEWHLEELPVSQPSERRPLQFKRPFCPVVYPRTSSFKSVGMSPR
jgi:hypothetical protein